MPWEPVLSVEPENIVFGTAVVDLCLERAVVHGGYLYRLAQEDQESRLRLVPGVTFVPAPQQYEVASLKWPQAPPQPGSSDPVAGPVLPFGWEPFGMRADALLLRRAVELPVEP